MSNEGAEWNFDSDGNIQQEEITSNNGIAARAMLRDVAIVAMNGD